MSRVLVLVSLICYCKAAKLASFSEIYVQTGDHELNKNGKALLQTYPFPSMSDLGSQVMENASAAEPVT